MNYSCLSKNTFQSGAFSLVSVRPEDIESIRQWRNAQMSVLRQSAFICPESQENYFSNEVWPQMDQHTPSQILLSFLNQAELIAYGGLVHIDWVSRKAEVSFLFDLSERSEEKYISEFSVFLTLLKQIAFDDLGLHRLWSESYDIRPVHIATVEQSGFQLEGRLKDHEWIDGRYVDTLFHGCVCGGNSLEK